jgi:hypothetical protein
LLRQLQFLKRLARFSGTEKFGLEVSFAIGETCGYILGAIFFVVL